MQINKIKILFFLFGGVGGAERMTINIGKMLPSEQFEVKFVVCGRMTQILQFIPTNYEVIRIPWHNIHVFSRFRMSRVILKEKPDFVFASTMSLNVRLIQCAKWCGVKSIVRNDSMLRYITSRKFLFQLSKRYQSAYHVIAQQEEMQQELIKLVGTNDRHIVCLHNPIDINTINQKIKEENPYPQDNSIKYLFVGNFTIHKAHDVLIEAFRIVHGHNLNAHLYLVGKTSSQHSNCQKIVKMVQRYGLQEYVHFVGEQINPYKWMFHSDCFVLPSRLEGLPNVLLEAMYLKRPVVASVCIPVIDRMVEEGYNGYKVKPEQPVAMAEAMEKALSLKDFELTFRTAEKEDFINLFK